MIDRLTADTQARLSYAIIGGYFALKILQGLGWLTDTGSDLKEIVMLVAFYWFQRQRPQETKPNA